MEGDAQLQKDLKFLHNRLYLWLHPIAYEENVVAIPRQAGGLEGDAISAVPYTQKVYSRLPRDTANHVLLQKYSVAKLKLDAQQTRCVGDLVFLQFVPVIKNQRVPLFLGRGILTSDIELIVYAGGGSHKVLQKYESPDDIVMHKSPRYGNYHIETADHLFFFEISIPDMAWPGEAWEVKHILTVVHKNAVGRMLRGDTEPVPRSVSSRDLTIIQSLSLDLAFHSIFGHFSDSRLLGRLRIDSLSLVSTTRVPRLPEDFNFYLNFSLQNPININWTPDFDTPINNLPQRDGFLSITIGSENNDYIALYDSKVDEIAENEVAQRIIAPVSLGTIALMTHINDQLKDLGRRVPINGALELVLFSKNGNVVLKSANFSVPLHDVNKWLQADFTEDEVAHIVQ